jgi:hypothetical protein
VPRGSGARSRQAATLPRAIQHFSDHKHPFRALPARRFASFPRSLRSMDRFPHGERRTEHGLRVEPLDPPSTSSAGVPNVESLPGRALRPSGLPERKDGVDLSVSWTSLRVEKSTSRRGRLGR